jgi:carboxyl-terminal processing protease
MFLRLGVFGVALLCIAAAADRYALTPGERQLNVNSFEYVWKTVRDKHWDPKLGGLNWQAVHDELLPKMEKAGNMDKAREVMTSMLERLKQSHFNIVPADVYREMESPGSRDGNPGIDVRVLDNKAIISSVDPGSPAARRGVKPGWQIVRVDGKDVLPGIRKIQEGFAKSTLLDLMLTRSVTSRLYGKSSKAVTLDMVDESDQSVGLELDRAKPRGSLATLGYLPPMYFWVEGRKIKPDIGYVRFDLFFEPETLIKTIEEVVKSCTACSGFIIDLRGNPGGIGGLATGVAGWFIDKPDLSLGSMSTRDNTIKFAVFPRIDAFRGPLAVLVDGCSGSTSEILAGGMKDLKRARIFGTRTAGAALPSVFEKLANNDGFQYAVANYTSQGGKPLEGIGVIPDEEVRITRQQLLAGQDPPLDAAVTWIEKQKK